MKTHTEALSASTALSSVGGIARIMSNKWAPVLEAPGEGGAGDEAAKAAAAAAAAAAKAAAEEEAAKEATKTAAKTGDPSVSDAMADLLKEQMKTKSKLKNANTELEQTKAALAAFDGLDPAEVKKLVQAQKDAEKAQAEAKGDFDRVKALMADEHKKELQREKDATAAKAKEVEERDARIADLTVGQAFRDSEFVGKDMIYTPAKAQKVFGDHFAYEDGVVVGYDKPAGKKDRTKFVGADGNPLSFDEVIKRLVDKDADKDSMLRSKMNPGAGSRTDAAGGAGKPQSDNSGLRGASRIAAALAAQKAGK